MRYESGSAFRMALEHRLRDEALDSGVPLVRLRKTVAFDRLLARLVALRSDVWLLKGGFALQLRMAGRSRTTKDIDLLLLESAGDVHAFLSDAAADDLGDWFDFEIAWPVAIPNEIGMRLSVVSRLDGRIFEAFHVDVGLGDKVVESADILQTTGLLRFAGIAPTLVPCYPVSQQVAEKLHALTLPRGAQGSSRVKDLVDLALIAESAPPDVSALRSAIDATFSSRATHPRPKGLPDAPSDWAIPYRRLATEAGLAASTLDAGMMKVRAFLEPALREK